MNIPTREEIKKAICWARSTQKEYGQCSSLRAQLRYQASTGKFYIVELQAREWAPLGADDIIINTAEYDHEYNKIPIDSLIDAAEKAIREKQVKK